MAQPKARTLQQRFGFTDQDLKTPAHDAIMMWLDKHVEDAVRGVVGSWVGDCKRWWAKNELAAIGAALDEPMTSKNIPLRVMKTIWERPVMNKGYMIGFVDLEARVELGTAVTQCANVRRRDWGYCEHKGEKGECHYDLHRSSFVYAGTKTGVEVCDEGAPEIKREGKRVEVLFEVKSKIQSIGEIIRQLQMYKSYITKPTIAVVCPDDRFADQLRGQGFGFVKCPQV